MKKFKIALWLILLGVAGLIAYQNKVFFMEKHSFTVDFFLGGVHKSPEWPNIAWFLACFFFGLLVAYFFSLMERFRANKTIKELKSKSESLLDMISQLRKELESRKTGMAAANTAPPIDVEQPSAPGQE